MLTTTRRGPPRDASPGTTRSRTVTKLSRLVAMAVPTPDGRIMCVPVRCICWRGERAMGDVEYVVHPEGELDIATVPALCEEWLSAIDEREPGCFVIDLAAVTFLDSSALSAIVAVRKRQREHGGEVVVVN